MTYNSTFMQAITNMVEGRCEIDFSAILKEDAENKIKLEGKEGLEISFQEIVSSLQAQESRHEIIQFLKHPMFLQVYALAETISFLEILTETTEITKEEVIKNFLI